MDFSEEIASWLRGTPPDMYAYIADVWCGSSQGFEDVEGNWKRMVIDLTDLAVRLARTPDGSHDPAKGRALIEVLKPRDAQPLPPPAPKPWHADLLAWYRSVRLKLGHPPVLGERLALMVEIEAGGTLPGPDALTLFQMVKLVRTLGPELGHVKQALQHQIAGTAIGDFGPYVADQSVLEHAWAALTGEDPELGPVRASLFQHTRPNGALLLEPIRALQGTTQRVRIVSPEDVERAFHPWLFEGESLHPIAFGPEPIAVLHTRGRPLRACAVVRVHDTHLEPLAPDVAGFVAWLEAPERAAELAEAAHGRLQIVRRATHQFAGGSGDGHLLQWLDHARPADAAEVLSERMEKGVPEPSVLRKAVALAPSATVVERAMRLLAATDAAPLLRWLVDYGRMDEAVVQWRAAAAAGQDVGVWEDTLSSAAAELDRRASAERFEARRDAGFRTQMEAVGMLPLQKRRAPLEELLRVIDEPGPRQEVERALALTVTSLQASGGVSVDALRSLVALSEELGTPAETVAAGGHLGLALAKTGDLEAIPRLEAVLATLPPGSWLGRKAAGRLKRLKK